MIEVAGPRHHEASPSIGTCAWLETIDRFDDRDLGTLTPRNGPLDGRAGSALVLRAPTLERVHKGRPGLPREARSITAPPETR